ncbi:5526_t:CDS:2 [Diversispora eburnea]|uniref:5526_t:CDS:1 n=1 Tax=Diversispora eburnea TaxID=1213867 RepID=A0A9N9FJZ6_9GLOM|nr:5526_t:CDS:2 [Diversispora eburnea]
MVKVPFSPTISVDEIVLIRLKNGIKNVNQTMNAFMISDESWKNESINVKDYYKQMSSKVKERYKIVTTPYFVSKFGTNQVATNENHVSLEINPLWNRPHQELFIPLINL